MYCVPFMTLHPFYLFDLDAGSGTIQAASFTGLNPGDLYVVSVATRSGDETSETVERHVATRPLPPSNVRADVTGAGTTNAQVTWEPPATVNQPISGYRIDLIPDDSRQFPQEFASTVRSAILGPGLVQGCIYSVKVWAIIDPSFVDKSTSDYAGTMFATGKS